MSTVVLFHHALGLTRGVASLASALEAAGHTVHAPDLFDGQTFETIQDGVAHANAIGFEQLLDRSKQMVDPLPEDVVFIGISLGVMPAQMLAQTRAGARGVVLIAACVPPESFGMPWPTDLPVEIHAAEDDSFFVEDGDIDAARELIQTASDAELVLYPGDQHLFMEPTVAGYDADATKLMVSRITAFLERI